MITLRHPTDVIAPSPWRFADGGLLLSSLTVSFVALLFAWWGTAEHATVNDQIGWLVLGIAAAGMAALCCAIFLASGYHAISLKRTELLRLLPVGASPATCTTAVGEARSELLLALPAASFFHRADCQFVRDKHATSAVREEHTAAGRRPCPACAP